MTKQQQQLVFVPLGGVGEIGMNMALYGFGTSANRQWMMVDCGMTFPDPHETGIDLILPDIDFIASQRENLLGIVITHAHEDHIGALAYLWEELRVPVYMTPFAHAMFGAKFPGMLAQIPITEIVAGGQFTLGDFSLEFVRMNHSIPEPMALVLDTPLGRIFHSADWRFDKNAPPSMAFDTARVEELGHEGVLALVSDSTNVVRDGESPSERDVAQSLERLIVQAPEQVAVTLFSSQVARIEAVVKAAEKAGRSVVVLGRALHRVIGAAKESGYLQNCPPILEESALKYLTRDKTVLLMTGSQGEPRAALARIAGGNFRGIHLSPGDRVIFSSRTIPGNETSVNVIINKLVDQGIEVITDTDALVHTSGHARRGEMEQFYKMLKPAIAIPVHGEAYHLSMHADYAQKWGVEQVLALRNGQMVRLAPGGGEIIDEVPVGRLHMDGQLMVRAGEEGLRERRKMAFNGQITVALAVTGVGELAGEILVSVMGLPVGDAEIDFYDIVYHSVEKAFYATQRKKRQDVEILREILRRIVRGEVNRVWGKKPECRILVIPV